MLHRMMLRLLKLEGACLAPVPQHCQMHMGGVSDEQMLFTLQVDAHFEVFPDPSLQLHWDRVRSNVRIKAMTQLDCTV